MHLAPLDFPDGPLTGNANWLQPGTHLSPSIINFGDANHAVVNDPTDTSSQQSRTSIPLVFSTGVTMTVDLALVWNDDTVSSCWFELYNEFFELIAGVEFDQQAATPYGGVVRVDLYADPDGVHANITIAPSTTTRFTMTFDNHHLRLYQGDTMVLATPTTSTIPVSAIKHLWMGIRCQSVGLSPFAVFDIAVANGVIVPV